jgi:hypothetical protein
VGSSVGWATLLVAGTIFATPAPAGPVAGASQVDQIAAKAANEPIEQLTHDVEHMHPVAMFVLAKRQFDAGNLNEAVFWYYEGKLRWLAYLRSDPARQGPFSEADRFGVFDHDISPDIDWCATEDVPNYIRIVNSVIDWDAAHPDDFTPNGSATKEAAREGLKRLVASTALQAPEIKKVHDEKRRQCPLNGAKDPNDRYTGNGGALFGTPPEMVSTYDPKRFETFRVGSTKKNEVYNALGAPEMWFTEGSGASGLSYSYHKAALPGSGLSERVVVTFKFDNKKVLTAIELPKEKAP